MSEITRILNSISSEDPKASEELLPLVYDELRRLAASKMQGENLGHTLQPTALVHEAWLRLARENTSWEDRRHFFRVAAEAMRRVLIDRARSKARMKRGGNLEHLPLDGLDVAIETDDCLLVRVNDALGRLAEEAPEKAEVVKLRFFVGLRIDETAEILGISPTTAKRHWNFARAWLLDALDGDF